jgi:hypothetical protein
MFRISQSVVITLYLLFILYMGSDDQLIKPKHASYVPERVSKYLILFLLLIFCLRNKHILKNQTYKAIEVIISTHIINPAPVYILRNMTQLSDDIIHHYVIRNVQHLPKNMELFWTEYV